MVEAVEWYRVADVAGELTYTAAAANSHCSIYYSCFVITACYSE